MTKNLLLLANIISISTGCSISNSQNNEVIQAINASVEHAKKDKVDLANYQVRSINLNTNGFSNLYEYASSDPYIVNTVKKLKSKRYWQVCYAHKDLRVAGASYCYFLNKTNLSLLASYRSK